MSERIRRAREALVTQVGMVARQLQVPVDAVTAYLEGTIAAHGASTRLAVSAAGDALELAAYRAGTVDHAGLGRDALHAKVSPQVVPSLGAVSRAQRVVGRYSGLTLDRRGAHGMPVLLDALWGLYGLDDALRILGVDDDVRARIATLGRHLGETRGHTLGVTVHPEGAGPLRIMHVVRFDAPGETAAVAQGIAALSRAVGVAALGEDFGAWFAHLRPGPTVHEVLVSIFVGADGPEPRVDVDFLALPTAYALDALGPLGVGEDTAELAALVEGLIEAPADPRDERWVDDLRVRFGPEGADVELAWFLNASRFMTDGAALN